MLVKQSVRELQISPHVAKKEKRLYLLYLQKLIVLHFDVNNQEKKIVRGKSRFYNKYINYGNKDSGLICFFNWNIERLPP